MLKRIALLVCALLLSANLVLAASAGGKVAAVDGEKVTLKMAKVPAWIKQGAVVSAIGGKPTVLEVNGNDVVLRFSKAKASKLKIDANLTVSEIKAGGGVQLQGC